MSISSRISPDLNSLTYWWNYSVKNTQSMTSLLLACNLHTLTVPWGWTVKHCQCSSLISHVAPAADWHYLFRVNCLGHRCILSKLIVLYNKWRNSTSSNTPIMRLEVRSFLCVLTPQSDQNWPRHPECAPLFSAHLCLDLEVEDEEEANNKTTRRKQHASTRERPKHFHVRTASMLPVSP